MRSLVTRARTALVLTTLVGALACDSSTEPPFLTEEEAADAFDALSTLGLGLDFFVAGDGSPAAFSSLKAASDLANAIETINESAPCPNGGNMTMVGEVEETASSFSVDIRTDYNNCVTTSSTERVWTFNGNPDIRTLLMVTETSFTGSIKGAIDMVSEELSGTCKIDIRITTTGIEGKVCGRSIDESFEG
jgi:hypothetical protein